jgi:hypothetical protein
MWLVHTAIFSKTFRVLGECGICKIFKCKIDVFWDHPCNIKLLLSVVSQRCRHWLQVNLISLPIIPMVLLMYCALSKPVLFRCPFSTVHLVNYDHINVWRIHTHSPIPRFFLSPWPVTEVALRFTDTEGGVVPAEVPQGEDVAAPWGPRP